jgi:hypothetical protein
MRHFQVTSWKNIKHCRPLSALLAAAALLFAGCGLIDTSQVVHYGYIDKTGKFVITPRFEIVREFSCERAVIGELADTKNYFYRWGFIDRSGNVVVKPQFKAVNSFSEGLAAVVLKDGKLGYIDKSGNFQIPAKFDSLPYETREAYETAPEASDFHEGRAAVYLNGKAGLIDTSGRLIVEPSLQFVGSAAEGLIPFAAKKGEFGFMNLDGKTVIEPRPYETVMPFSEALALVQFREGRKRRVGFIDKTGKTVLTDPSWFMASSFHEGLACITLRRSPSERDFLDGFIDKTGKFVISPKFKYAGRFSDGLAIAGTAPGTFGYIDKTGNWLTGPDYHTMMFYGFSEGLAAVPLGWIGDRTWGYIDTHGKQVIPASFALPSHIEPGVANFHEGLAAVGVPDKK